MRILSAGLHLFIAYPATKVTPQPQLESRMLTLSGVDHLPKKLTYKKMYQINGHSQDGRNFPSFMANLPLQMPSATTTVGLKIPMAPRGAFE